MFDTRAMQAHFGRAAAIYDEKAVLQRQVLEEALPVIAPHWGQGARIIDIGSGTGLLAAESQKRSYGWQVTGCDIAYGMCEYARRQGYASINADAHHLPFADGVFDGACSSLMLQWAVEPREVFNEMARVTRPNSYSLITTFTKGSMTELQEAFKSVDTRPHTTPFRSMNEWGMDASSAGFAVKKLQERRVVEYYASTLELMRAIKSIGAGNKLAGRRRPLTRAQLAQVEEAYRSAFARPEGLPLTWKILTLLLYKK